MRLAEHLGIEVQARPIDRTELYIADEAFMCGSSAHITPILSIDQRKVGNQKIGPITKQIADLYKKVQQAEVVDFDTWITAL